MTVAHSPASTLNARHCIIYKVAAPSTLSFFPPHLATWVSDILPSGSAFLFFMKEDEGKCTVLAQALKKFVVINLKLINEMQTTTYIDTD